MEAVVHMPFDRSQNMVLFDLCSGRFHSAMLGPQSLSKKGDVIQSLRDICRRGDQETYRMIRACLAAKATARLQREGARDYSSVPATLNDNS